MSLAIDLSELQRTWNLLGRSDPLWAVLSDPRYHGNKWDIEEFFRLGQAEIDHIMRRLGELGVTPPLERALDFGCGVGRLTLPLAKYFRTVAGVDIAPAMITLAQKFNQFPQTCTYYLNNDDSLALFESETFDFVYTRLVLQHMRPELSRRYIPEFFRVLRPGGIAAFQIPGQYRGAENAIFPPDPARLPDGAFNALITVNQPMFIATPGSELTFALGIVNFSGYVWPGAGSRNPLAVCARWLDQCSRPIAKPEDVMPIPRDTMPGDRTYLTLTPRAPQEPGFYLVQLDIVQTGAGRGSERGSPTPFVAVTAIEGADPDKVASFLPFNAQMEYHGLPRAEVEALVAGSGGELIAVSDDSASRPDWPGHLYIARKT